MEFVYSTYTTAYLAAGLISVLAAVFACRRKHVPGGIWLCAMSICCAIWAFAVALDYSSVSLDQHVFWGKMSYLGATAVTVFYFVFVFVYHGASEWGKPRRVMLLLLVPIVVTILAFTNEAHHLVWTSFTVAQGHPNLISYGHGPVYWIILTYGLTLAVIASMRLLGFVILARSMYRAQSIAVVVAVMLPLIAQIVYSAHPDLIPGFDPSITLSITNAVLVFTMLRFNLLDVAPVPRSVLVERMADGLLVTDHEGRVVEINPSAVHILGVTKRPVHPILLSELLVHWPDAVAFLTSAPHGESPGPLISDSGMCIGVNRIGLDSISGGFGRDLYLLRDITESARATEALHVVVQDLQAKMQQIEILQVELREQAIQDLLTGLYNRRYLAETFSLELSRAAREEDPVSIIMFDLDFFKEVNDTLGHAQGDEILRAVGAELKEHARAGDIAARYGGDEFLVILPNTTLAAAAQVAERWRASFPEVINRLSDGDLELRVTLSLGVATFPLHGTSAEEVIAAADAAVYASKNAGRNRVSTAPLIG